MHKFSAGSWKITLGKSVILSDFIQQDNIFLIQNDVKFKHVMVWIESWNP